MTQNKSFVEPEARMVSFKSEHTSQFTILSYSYSSILCAFQLLRRFRLSNTTTMSNKITGNTSGDETAPDKDINVPGEEGPKQDNTGPSTDGEEEHESSFFEKVIRERLQTAPDKDINVHSEGQGPEQNDPGKLLVVWKSTKSSFFEQVIRERLHGTPHCDSERRSGTRYRLPQDTSGQQ